MAIFKKFDKELDSHDVAYEDVVDSHNCINGITIVPFLNHFGKRLSIFHSRQNIFSQEQLYQVTQILLFKSLITDDDQYTHQIS